MRPKSPNGEVGHLQRLTKRRFSRFSSLEKHGEKGRTLRYPFFQHPASPIPSGLHPIHFPKPPNVRSIGSPSLGRPALFRVLFQARVPQMIPSYRRTRFTSVSSFARNGPERDLSSEHGAVDLVWGAVKIHRGQRASAAPKVQDSPGRTRRT